MPSVGPWELILILVIALIIFGPGKLPEVGRSLGKSINEFKRASADIKRQVEDGLKEEEKEKEKEKT
ncbi:MAG: twin-arginine translocase TatA/TatE family subunit [Firmicutes bacterium]|nr:twin-arginine translocase TatA/TatE family subunit [Bacillota bacterium]